MKLLSTLAFLFFLFVNTAFPQNAGLFTIYSYHTDGSALTVDVNPELCAKIKRRLDTIQPADVFFPWLPAQHECAIKIDGIEYGIFIGGPWIYRTSRGNFHIQHNLVSPEIKAFSEMIGDTKSMRRIRKSPDMKSKILTSLEKAFSENEASGRPSAPVEASQSRYADIVLFPVHHKYTVPEGIAGLACANFLGFDTVESFQKHHNLKQDGIVGAQTWSTMEKELSKIGASVDINAQDTPLSLTVRRKGNKFDLCASNKTNSYISLKDGHRKNFRMEIYLRYGERVGGAIYDYRATGYSDISPATPCEIGKTLIFPIITTAKIPPHEPLWGTGSVLLLYKNKIFLTPIRIEESKDGSKSATISGAKS